MHLYKYFIYMYDMYGYITRLYTIMPYTSHIFARIIAPYKHVYDMCKA